MDIGASDIDRWHRERGWLKIGYHYVITRDGSVPPGRAHDEIGAHAKGHNARSVGICLVGGVSETEREPERNFTESQWGSLGNVVDSMVRQYPGVRVIGHNRVSNKACPSFDVGEWYEQHRNKRWKGVPRWWHRDYPD